MPALLLRADPQYPRRLLTIHDPPERLWVEGDLSLLSEEKVLVAVVGARECTPYGKAVASDLGRALAEAGVVVVSGMAFGIDAAAHRGALAGGGKTIAVLGTGIDITYPKEHEGLMKEIIVQGAVASELPPGTAAAPWTFPARNRIISGLARGVVVVEARERSGALITARHALDQGREVFAVPGDIRSPLSEGCHRLIQSGAKLVMRVSDVLEELGLTAEMKASDPASPVASAGAWGPSEAAHSGDASSLLGRRTGPPMSEEGRVLNLLSGGPRHIDEIAEATGSHVERLAPLLVSLEIGGKIRSLPGSRFVRV